MKYSRKMLAGATSLMFVFASSSFSATIEERLENLESNLELAEEANAELRSDLENRMKVSGYMDVEYVVSDTKDSGFRMHHLSLFFQKKLSDKWRFFSEIEYEDAPKFEGDADYSTVVLDDAQGKIFVEAVNLDYLWKPQAIFRVGRFFTPAGIWSIDHYPPFVPTQERPKHIRKIFPQLIDGGMIHGTLGLGKNYFKYNAYVANGEKNIGKKDDNSHRAFGLKSSVILAMPGFSHVEAGGTVYSDSRITGEVYSKNAIGAHAKIVMKDISFQTEAAYSKYDAESGVTVPGTIKGYYGQLVYSPSQWSVGARHDYYNNPDSGEIDRTANSLFVNYRALTNLVLKVEHHLISVDGKDDATKTIFSVVSYLE